MNKTVVAQAQGVEEMTDEMRDSLANVAQMEDSLANVADSAQNDPHKREYYLAQIPFTEEQVEASNLLIMDGLYNAGVIFKDKLDNLVLSEKELRRLADDYPTYEHMDNAYYHLFLLYSRMHQPQTAASYLEKLKSGFPDSEWTTLLSDPHFVENSRYGVHLEDSLYAATYDAFKADKFMEVKNNVQISATRFPLGANRDKFIFFDGMAKLNSGDAKGCIDDMKTVVDKYPKSEVSTLAGMIVNGVNAGRKLHGGKFDISDVWERRVEVMSDSDSIKTRKFTAERNVDFSFIIAYQTDSINENQLLFELAKYNFSNFLVRNFEIAREEVEGLERMVISGFKSYDEALQYARQLYSNNNILRLTRKARAIIISDSNKESQALGLGNRSNMVLQAAFFKLAKVIPVEDAVEHMKAAVKKTYGLKGEKVVNMNIAAVDAGINALVEVKVKPEWTNLTGKALKPADESLPYVIKNILVPINAQKGDELPVSAFKGMEDGTMPLGTSKYEKRGIATHLPVWDAAECLQCNMCSFVCPHAVIRPFLLDEGEVKAAPVDMTLVDAKGPGLAGLKYTMGVSTLDCTSCGSCVASCPKSGKALKMVPAHEVSLDQTDWNFLTTVKEKTSRVDKFTLKGSQFKQPLVEFNGACAGCGETPYIKLLTQMFGDKMYLANATGCTQAWGAAMPCVPYCKNAEGKGVAWSNSLFENNAEFSYGMCLAVKQLRDCVTGYVKELDALTKDEAVKAAIAKWLETYDDLDASTPATAELVKLLESGKFSAEEQKLVDEILKRRKDLSKKTMWMYGGDGWAYDIGYGGLDHVFAMGEDVNVLLVDTEVYSNTGGQSSKATPVGAVAQFQASGKKTKKKDLGMLMMTYDNVYVAQCSMGANPNQLIKAIKEAEAHKGPSIVICYAPCINHGIKKGMNNVQQEMKDAVASGYWNLYRYSPETKTFTLDSKEPTMPLYDFMKGEVRSQVEQIMEECTKGGDLYERLYEAAGVDTENSGETE